jgi:carboxyl-terminal processing protease
MIAENIQKNLICALIYLITLAFLAGCLPGLSRPELPKETKLSSTPLLAEVLMRIQLDYLELETLDLHKLQEAALLALESEIAEVRFVSPKRETGRQRVLFRENFLVSLDPPGTLREMYEGLQSLTLDLQEKLPEYQTTELELITLSAIMSGLDPHSIVLQPSNYAEFNENTRGRFAGVGIVIGLREKQLTITSLMKGGPAERAGLLIGDQVREIDGESTKKMSLSAIMQGLRGEIGSNMGLTVQRAGEEVTFDLQREDIQISSSDSVDLHFDGRIPVRYIRLKLFQEDTSADLEKKLENLDSVAGLILDLRGNPGGLLQEAVRVSDLFLPPKKRIVSTQTNTSLTSYDSHQLLISPRIQTIPIVILVNRQSASASEIVSAALRANNRAIILGEKTFGKGSVQSIWGMPGNFGLKMTIARYLTPDNLSIQDVGVQPDLQLAPLYLPENRIHLRSLQQKATSGNYILHYLRDIADEETDIDKPLNAADLANDDYVRIAVRLLSEHVPNQEDMKATLARSHSILQSQAEMEVVEEIARQVELDWSLSFRTHTEIPDLQISFEQKDDRGVWQGITQPFASDRTLRIKIQLENKDSMPMERALVVSESSEDWLDDLEFPFGKLEGGEKDLWTHDIALDQQENFSWLPLDLVALAGEDQELLRIFFLWSVIPDENPKFSLGFKLIDNGTAGSFGNGDGLPQSGETVAIEVNLEMQEIEKLAEVVLRIGSSEDSLVWLQDRVEWKSLKRGESYQEYLLVRIPQEVQDLGRWQVALFGPRLDQALWNYHWIGDQGPDANAEPPVVQTSFQRDDLPILTNDKDLIWHLELLDQDGLKDLLCFVNGRKLNYFNLNKKITAELVWKSPLELGKNLIELVARDTKGVSVRHQWQIWRESPEEMRADVVSEQNEYLLDKM